MGNEIISMVDQFMQGVEVSAETLARDLIHRVGPGGHFLDRTHTAKHFKAHLWEPDLSTRFTYNAWMADGSKDMAQRVQERVRHILETHQIPELPGNVLSSIEKIRKRGEKPSSDHFDRHPSIHRYGTRSFLSLYGNVWLYFLLIQPTGFVSSSPKIMSVVVLTQFVQEFIVLSGRFRLEFEKYRNRVTLSSFVRCFEPLDDLFGLCPGHGEHHLSVPYHSEDTIAIAGQNMAAMVID